MITPEYCRLMAHYNIWQNGQLARMLEDVSPEDLRAERGAFFGSILGTLSHILWGDAMWLSRFGGDVEAPEGGIKGSTGLCGTLGEWRAERSAMDGRISQWAGQMSAARLSGELEFMSAALGARVRRPMAPCVIHMFNHQTHHRGQVHAMMTGMGLEAPESDLFLMPEEV